MRPERRPVALLSFFKHRRVVTSRRKPSAAAPLAGFVDLTSVSFTGFGGENRSDLTLDDNVVNPVPEPSTYVMAAIVIVALLFARRRK